EAAASRAVLGVSYDELGAAIGRSWNLPPALLASMRPLAEERPARPSTPAQRLHLAAAVADARASGGSARSPGERGRRLKASAARFETALGLDGRALGAIAADAAGELLSGAAALLGDPRKSRYCQSLRQSTVSGG